MCRLSRLLVIVALGAQALPLAQAVPDVSGHWEGVVRVPDMEVKIEVDLARNSSGTLAGTFGQPAQGVKGLPLSTVAVADRVIRFVVRAGEAPATFEGTLSADDLSIGGTLRQGEYTIPFSLKRTGEAKIAAAPKSPAIGKELEGLTFRRAKSKDKPR